MSAPPRPVPRKRNVVPKSSSSSTVTKTSSGPVKELNAEDVKGLRSKLDEMSMRELRDILEDAGALLTLISSLNVPQLDSVRSSRDNAVIENRRLAEQNLEYKPQLEELRNELLSVEATMHSLMDTYTQYYEQLPELSKNLDNQKILGQLQRSVTELESQTEEMAENFIAGRMDEVQFMDQYMTSRGIFWLRKVKAEKMDELLNPTAPKIPAKQSQPLKPSPYRAAVGARANSVNMPSPSAPAQPRANAPPTTQPPAIQQQSYPQGPPPSQQPYRQPVPPASGAAPVAPYPQQPRPQYQPQRPPYYPQQRPPYPYQPQQPRYPQSQPRAPAPYPVQGGYRPTAYPQQPRYPPQPGYQRPPQQGYYPYQQQPYRYR